MICLQRNPNMYSQCLSGSSVDLTQSRVISLLFKWSHTTASPPPPNNFS